MTDPNFTRMVDVFAKQAEHELLANAVERTLDYYSDRIGIRRLTQRRYWRAVWLWAKHTWLSGVYEGEARQLARQYRRH